MSEHTNISWTTSTWNPWHGCTHVSAGCDNCYMFAQKKQYGQDPEKVVRSKTKFNDPLKWKEPRRVFTCSWSDFFHVEADPWRDEAWDIIRRTPHLTYQILTKRPGRIARHVPHDWGDGWPHVWIGVSIESQEYAYRARQLVGDVPAITKFVSAEPLLGPLNIRPYLDAMPGAGRGISWVIAGGESGPRRRPMELEWLTALARDCAEFGTAFWCKQDSAFKSEQQGRIPDDVWALKQFPVSHAGAP